ncbi:MULTISPECIES: DUF2569 domain-containing protein [Acinetobacter]|uniref:DUF2569 domain-containing protein n=1 Tax=Acinetobacter baylyi (strain ATCC 33305 / BD413 / ADP1) TaxID=62977 RepID=Q6F8W8_ACIAD|nr:MULTISPECIES: DUF2569 domain-containing protein [Acinetobacter]ENV53420.1 hypothetical protein F952_02481 [Acinetobacter baylyi DSM 14961 = CIP 107474]KAF2370769.1 hypothetical protein BSL88_09140 [Acinetobacter baylyi]KAF2375094.1 hypothetical protein BSL67_02000 [Acinetobacter baylyi]KAF2378439.1 hypothetical protein BSN81_03280 [Acinetobacter baylyi]KAF2380068.1 hypothetical protein BSN83_12305 [Acinetobacter baylyi]
MDDINKLKGLGGWLTLVGFGLIVSPIRLIVTGYQTYYPMFSEGIFNSLTSVDSVYYHPLWIYYILGEITVNTIFVLTSFVLLYLFFKKHYLFPKVFISVCIAMIIFILIDASLIKLILPNEEIFDSDTASELMRSIFYGMIWIPYMMFSKRVKVNFVEK